jgi:predicted alpha/beta hydrolase
VQPAFAVRRRYYAAFAAFLAERGAAVLTYDYRGVGDSAPPRLRGFAARMSDWGERDTEGALRWLAERFPGLAPRIAGHSAGGQVLGMAPSAARVERALFVACQSGWWGHWSGWHRARLLAVWHFAIPVTANLFGYLPGFLGIGLAVPRGVALEWAWWGRHPDYLLRGGGPRRRAAYAALAFPLVSVSLADDLDLAPPRAVQALVEMYPGTRGEHRRLAPADFGRPRVGHFGFFRREVGGSRWEELGAWLLA